MKTYAEIENGESFDWNKFLNQDYKDFDSDSLDHARTLANAWTTCAVGNQCNIIPRYYGDFIDGKFLPLGCPVDKELRELGMEFSNKIESMVEYHWKKEKESFLQEQEETKSILLQIELRSSYLINEIKKQSK